MPDVDFKAWIAHESDTFASTLDAGQLGRRVPGCPDWTLRDLAWHLGGVQRFWSTVVRAGVDVEPAFQTGTGPTVAGDLADWMRASTATLLDALGAAPSGTPA